MEVYLIVRSYCILWTACLSSSIMSLRQIELDTVLLSKARFGNLDRSRFKLFHILSYQECYIFLSF